MQYRVRLFGPGVPSVGQDAVLHVETASAYVIEPRLALPFDAEFRFAGWSQPRLAIEWGPSAHLWSVQLLEGGQEQQLLSEFETFCPGAVASYRKTQARSRSRHRKPWFVVLLVVLGCIAAASTVVVLLSSLANRAVDSVSPELERQLGEQSLQSMKSELEFCTESPGLQAIAALGKRITQGSKYHYSYYVVSDQAINAFALPGGIIVVNRGLIERTESAEELAGVLAHEVEHVELRHSLRQLSKQLGVWATFRVVSGSLGSSLGSELVQKLIGLKFTRDDEQQADTQGFERLLRHHINPAPMLRFFEKLAAEPAPPALLSSHPSSRDRVQHLRSMLQPTLGHAYTPLNLGSWPPPLNCPKVDSTTPRGV